MMAHFRARAATLALLVALAYISAPVAAAGLSAAAALAGPVDCCAKGAHPAGMCPLRHARHDGTCRISCAASASGAILLAAAELPPAESLAAPAVRSVEIVALIQRPLELIPALFTPPPRS